MKKLGVLMLINKDNLPLVAMDFMNNTHFEDVDIINELYENILNYDYISFLSNIFSLLTFEIVYFLLF